MKTVGIFTSKSLIPDYAVTPIRYSKKTLHEKGYKIKIFYDLRKQYLCCNILCLLSKPLLYALNMMRTDTCPVYKEPNPVISFLKNARKYTDKIIWMDDSDSTGVTHFELLPYVDLYLKKQLFKDRKLYQKRFYGGRIWSDFYHREFGVEDSVPFEQFYSLDEKFCDKVDVSWNIGLGNMYDSYTKKGRLRRLIPDYWPASYKVPYVEGAKKRDFDLFIRMSTNLTRESLAFHRVEVARKLKKLSKEDGSLRLPLDKWYSFSEYNQLMANSKIAVSPFGYGELCVRDWSAFIFGACLLKPSMMHLETWPDIFIEGVTYQPFNWGFDDFESVIYELLENDKKRIEIAENGQKAYLDSISPAGMEKFCDWFIKQIEK